MRENKLLQKLKENRVALGYANSFPHPGAVEYGCQGWDFIWICSQHGYYDYESTYHCMMAAELNGVATVVRVPGHEPGYIGRIMDLAPSAIMVPFVNNAEQAEIIAKTTFFPPLGARLYGGVRSMTLHGGNYFEQKHTLVIAQIETEEAVRNAEGIVSAPGIDMLFFSADDMRMSMAIPVDTAVEQSPLLAGYMQRVGKACRDCGKLAGIVAVSDTLTQMAIDAGFTSIVSAGDRFFLGRSRPYSEELRVKVKGFIDHKGGVNNGKIY